jgi:hypothetical protein
VPVLAKENAVSEIDVKEAVRLAKEFAARIYETEKISRLGLEAVERTDDGKHWLVTLGFSRPWSYPKARGSFSPLEEVLPRPKQQPEREYKVFRVDANTGAVLGIDRIEE